MTARSLILKAICDGFLSDVPNRGQMTIFDELRNNAKSSENNVEIFVRQNPNDDLIRQLGLSERSTLGNILKYTNGITVDSRFLRLLGAGDSEWTDSIELWNNFPGQEQIADIPNGCLLIGYDVLGGFFAINGGLFGSDLGNVYYFAPDSLNWENMNVGHTQFISWCFAGNVGKFYEGFRWHNYQSLVHETKKGEGILSSPFLWTKEGKDLNVTSKKVVPLREIWSLNVDIKRQLDA